MESEEQNKQSHRTGHCQREGALGNCTIKVNGLKGEGIKNGLFQNNDRRCEVPRREYSQ